MRTGGIHSEFDVTPGGRAGGEGGGGGGPKSILYKHSRVAYQIKGNED